jgi:GT2 family glycosyltransferase
VTEAAPFTVVVCTRDRAALLSGTLDALLGQAGSAFPVLVVDQSDQPDAALARRAAGEPRLELVADGGQGLSRARNIGSRRAASEWVAFVDDDCVPEPGWAQRLAIVLTSAPEGVEIVSGHVDAPVPEADYVPASAFGVERSALVRGRFRHPGRAGFGVCMAVRRTAIERLGGWDERLGPGVPRFPAADDMDFNYRLLRSGGVALLTPEVRSRHLQWRTPGELGPLYRGYLRAWSGFAMKQLRGGDVAGGLWLWTIGLVDFLDMLASALGRRSRLRLRLALAKLRGLAEGTVAGLRTRW